MQFLDSFAAQLLFKDRYENYRPWQNFKSITSACEIIFYLNMQISIEQY